MSRLASELHRLRRLPWEVLRSVLVSGSLVLFLQLAVAIVPRLFPSISLLANRHAPRRRFCRRFIGVAASEPLFMLFNVPILWDV